MNTQLQVVVPWYAEDSYADLVSQMEDGSHLPATYASWRHGFDEQVQSFRSRGMSVRTPIFEPRAFLDWCRTHGLRPNAEARIEYLDYLAPEMHS